MDLPTPLSMYTINFLIAVSKSTWNELSERWNCASAGIRIAS